MQYCEFKTMIKKIRDIPNHNLVKYRSTTFVQICNNKFGSGLISCEDRFYRTIVLGYKQSFFFTVIMCLQLPLHCSERKGKYKRSRNLPNLMMGLEERGKAKEISLPMILHMYMIS